MPTCSTSNDLRPARQIAPVPRERQRALAALLALPLSLLGLLARPASARECAGGTLRSLDMNPGGIEVSALMTYAGASHDNFVQAPQGFSLSIVDAENPTTVYLDVDVPADRFNSTASTTRYDRMGTFNGSIRLTNSSSQADTVVLKLSTPVATALPIPATASLRVFLGGGELCSKTCVAACTRPALGVMTCNPSAHYVPFTDYGFGQLNPGRVPIGGGTSSVCAVDVRAGGPRCDFLVDDHCLMPYPSSVFLDNDPTTPTGKRIHYDLGSMPKSFGGVNINPADWNTLDGFGPGPMIETIFPDTGFEVDRVASGAAFHTDFEPSLDAAHPTVLMEWTSGDRVLHFVELDENKFDVDEKALIMRPGVRLKDDTRYIVAIRDLVDTMGNPILPRAVFRILRDRIPATEVEKACGVACANVIGARRAMMNKTLRRLRANGVPTDDLLIAWDFHTASTEALTGWLVSMRDQAAALPTPTFTVTNVDNGGGAGRNTHIWARVSGTFQAPLFMTADAPGSRINLVNGVPTQNGFGTIPFVVDIPRSAKDGSPARSSLFGHGLLGDRTQIGALSEFANLGNVVIAGVDMQGMSTNDLFSIIPVLGTDLSNFHVIPERLHQGILNHLLLGRLLADPVNGFSSHAAFKIGAGGASIFDTSQVYYAGGSQGGILGGTIMAVSEIFERGVLVVPASNYSTLLQRSFDFVLFLPILNGTYPTPLDQIVLYPLIQQLWDRADSHAYLPHLLPGTLSDPPFPHKVLLHMATYDSEVSNLGTEIQARSLGIPQVGPVHRSFFGIAEVDAPFDGSALVEIDPGGEQSRCHTPGDDDRGAACTTDANCPGPGDPPSRTQCVSGIPPLTNVFPPFNNGAHGQTANATTILQINEFMMPDGMVEHVCDGPCDPE